MKLRINATGVCLVIPWVLFILIGCNVVTEMPSMQSNDSKSDIFIVETSVLLVGTAEMSRSINDLDAALYTVWAKVFNSSRIHLPADTQNQISQLTKVTIDGQEKWTGTIKLDQAAGGTITFLIWAEDAQNNHIYSGTGTWTEGTSASITVSTSAGYSNQAGYGPAGGYVFYDKGFYSPTYNDEGYASESWRYLEAAPTDALSGTCSWGIVGQLVENTKIAIGTGKSNTAVITAFYPYTYTSSHYCRDYTRNGFDDWFLPSKDELEQMYLKHKALYPGNPFQVQTWGDAYYFSSSEIDESKAWTVAFRLDDSGGMTDQATKSSKYVRPVRRF